MPDPPFCWTLGTDQSLEHKKKRRSRAKNSLPSGNSYLREKRRERAMHTVSSLNLTNSDKSLSLPGWGTSNREKGVQIA